LEANPTPTTSWYLDTKDLSESDGRFITKNIRKVGDQYLLSMEIKVKLSFSQ
jgi:hypothetical protein